MNMMLIIGGGVTAMLIVLALLLTPEGAGHSKAVSRRIERIHGVRIKLEAKRGEAASSVRRYQIDSGIPWLNKLIRAFFPNPDKLRQRLEKTGKSTTIGVYCMINLLLGIIFYLVAVYMAHQKPLVGTAIAIASGLFFPHVFTGMMGAKRVGKFIANFPEAIDTMTRGLRSGLPVSESIATVGREMPDPVGEEFRTITSAVRLGMPMEDAMWDVARRIDAPEYRFLIIAMSIQRETGGNLAETLGNLSDLLRKRRQLKLKIRALSSEARASAMILGALPFIMFFILFLVNRDYILTLMVTQAGHKLIAIALVLMGIGHGIMAKMIRFEV